MDGVLRATLIDHLPHIIERCGNSERHFSAVCPRDHVMEDDHREAVRSGSPARSQNTVQCNDQPFHESVSADRVNADACTGFLSHQLLHGKTRGDPNPSQRSGRGTICVSMARFAFASAVPSGFSLADT